LAAIRTARLDHANAQLAAISDDFARLYGSIHPSEDVEQIRLYLHEAKAGSAQLDGELFGCQSVSPVAYLSESHLDTLGLCLFLALEKQSAPRNTILFLDDAIASVDEAHMERLYEMIVGEASQFKHVVISSHYQPLRFKFKWGQITRQNVDIIELGRWTLDEGIFCQRGCEREIVLLERRLQEQDDPSGIAGKAGIVHEYLLDFLTGIYRCRLPRSQGAEQRWTLADYKSGLEGGKRRLLKSMKCDHLGPDGSIVDTFLLEPLLEDVFKQLELRNMLGAHYKELAGQFDQLQEASNLGRATMSIAKALCDDDLQLPEKCRDGVSWTNAGTNVSRRLTPHIQPTG
jgi:hypothetical protein